MIDSCGTNSGGKLPFSQNTPGKICASWDTLPLPPSAHQRESCADTEVLWVHLQCLFSGDLSPFSGPDLHTKKLLTFKPAPSTRDIQDTNFSSVLKHTQHLLVAPQPLWSAHPCLNSLNVSAQLKLRKQPKEWIDSVQIICLRQLRPIFKTTPHLSVPQLGFYLSGTSLKKCKITSIILQM